MAFHAVFAITALIVGFVNADDALLQPVPQQVTIQKYPVTETCLGCICEALGKCSPTVQCDGNTCGMFGITWAYWYDSGSPVLPGSNPKDSDAYPKCANDANCARTSVVNYLTRFAQDCNNDGVIDCLDYASIHKLGGYGCGGYLNDEFKNRFLTCQGSVQQLSG